MTECYSDCKHCKKGKCTKKDRVVGKDLTAPLPECWSYEKEE